MSVADVVDREHEEVLETFGRFFESELVNNDQVVGYFNSRSSEHQEIIRSHPVYCQRLEKAIDDLMYGQAITRID